MDSIRFDRLADRYDDTRGGEQRGERFALGMVPLLDRDASVLEVGIGTGTVAMALQAAGFSVVGVDLSEPMLARAHARLGPVVAAADAARMPFPAHTFKQAISTWVLHLVGDVPAVLAEVARALTPDGRYLVIPGRMVERDDPIGQIKVGMAEALVDDRARRARTEPEALREAAPAAGLVVVEVVELEPYKVVVSADEEAQRIEDRSYSGLWAIDEQMWERVVVPVIRGLRGLPDGDKQVTHTVSDVCVVLEKR